MPFGTHAWPRAIVHVDGDSFFVACEMAVNPTLKNKPVVTGQERGIASAMSIEAKKLGITRGMPIAKIRREYPQVIVVSSDYDTYSLFSHRMLAIVRRYTPTVEPYSIDECFADITGFRQTYHKSYEDIAHDIKNDLENELGLSFSLGLGTTKVIAKIASNWNKPSGFTAIDVKAIDTFLKSVAIGDVWGIGHNSTALLQKYNIKTAYEFSRQSEAWVQQRFAKPFYDLWCELRGVKRYEVDPAINDATPKSISRSRTFVPTTDYTAVASQLSKNIEHVCAKLRDHELWTSRIYFYLKNQDFRFSGFELKLRRPTHSPSELCTLVEPYLKKIFSPRTQYRTTGIVASHLTADQPKQMDLFGEQMRAEVSERVYGSVDALIKKYGPRTIFLGSSFDAMQRSAGRTSEFLPTDQAHKPFGIPFLGETT